MTCWMCADDRFRSACAHHPTGVSTLRGVPLRDPSPRARQFHERN